MAEIVKKKHAKIQYVLEKAKVQLYKRLFILQWLPKYTKNDILADLIAGFTVGLTMIPQSIAYAGLAELPAQYGLYTAFIGSYTYMFFGTIKEVSIGPTSLMSLLTISYTVGKPVEYVILLTFIAGCVELFMGLLKLGFLIDFISPCLTSGFTSASALIIISAQLKNLFGINIKGHNFLQIIKEFFQKCNELRVPDTVMGFTCIAFLLVFKNLTKFKVKNPLFKKSLWLLSISKNAIIVVIATVVAVCYDHDGVTIFKITGTVPKGIPNVQFPSLTATLGNNTVGYVEMVKTLGSGIALIPLVAILANVAIAKSYSTNSIVDASQEMMSLGLCNIFGSFIRAMPSTGAFTRSAVASSSDVRTPLQGLYSGTIIVFALSFLAPYFYYIPKAVLAAVLITAVSSLFDYKIFPVLWKCNKVDFFLTLGTFLIGTLFGVEAAIVLGCIFNLLILFRLWSRPKVEVDIREKPDSEEKYLYIKPELGLYYPGADYVSECIKKNRGENPNLPIVLDCSNILRLDYAAAITLINILKTYNDTQPSLVMINVEEVILNILKTVSDSNYLRLCSETNSIPDVIVDDNAEEEEEENLLTNVAAARKISKISVESSRFLENENRDDRLSKVSFESDTRSSVSKNNQRKFSVYSLE